MNTEANDRIRELEERLARAESLLVSVRNADVIFAKSDWDISRAIADYLNASIR